MAEQVITEFRLEIGQFEQQLQALIKRMEAFEKSTVSATAATEELSGDIGGASEKVRELTTVTKAVDAAIGKGLGDRLKTASTLFGQLKQEAGGTLPALRAVALELSVRVSKGLQGVGASLKGVGKAFSEVGGSLKVAAKEFGSYAKEVAGSIPVVGNLLVALGPVGIAIGAVAAGLFKLFSNLDAGATAIDGFRRSAGIAFDQVTGAVRSLFDSLNAGDTVAGKVFGTIVDGLKFVLVTANPVITAFKTIFASALEAGQEVAALYDDLDEAQTRNIVANAKLEQQVNKLVIQLKDRTKTEEERLAIADRITALENQRAAEEQKLLKQSTAAIQREADIQLKAKQEVDDDLKRRLAEAQAA